MDCEQLWEAYENAKSDWEADPTQENLQLMNDAYQAWFAQCGTQGGPHGGGTPLPTGGGNQ